MSAKDSQIKEFRDSLVQFKDPVYGYISIPKSYVLELIDTTYMQRLKGIGQSGIRPIFSAANHDRFSHSLGVYKFSNMVYKSLSRNLKNAIKKQIKLCEAAQQDQDKEKLEKLMCKVDLWKNIVSIAALLHDVGHPARSHGFEFLYDDKYMKLPGEDGGEGCKVETCGSENNDKFLSLNKHLTEGLKPDNKPDNTCNFEVKGSPHERMSAYFILADKDLKSRVIELIELYNKNYAVSRGYYDEKSQDKFNKSLSNKITTIIKKNPNKNNVNVKNVKNVKENIKDIIEAFGDRSCNDRLADKLFAVIKEECNKKTGKKDVLNAIEYTIKTIARNRDNKLKKYNKIINLFNPEEEIKFICRMITGTKYNAACRAKFDYKNYENSVRNCIIAVLNGTIDADNMDYIMRNSYSAGYSTHSVDHERLCSSFNVYKYRNTLKPCFDKKTLSVLEGYIVARNFEPKWLYSHHKVVYYDLLVKTIYRIISKYLKYLDMKALKEQGEKDEACKNRPYSTYYSHILSTHKWTKHAKFNFSDLTDADLDSLIKSIRLDISSDELEAELDENEKKDKDLYDYFNKKDLEMLRILTKEHSTRKLKKSMWKSYPDYKLAMKVIAKNMGVDFEDVDTCMHELITKGLMHSTFDKEGDNKDNPNYQREIVYYPSLDKKIKQAKADKEKKINDAKNEEEKGKAVKEYDEAMEYIKSAHNIFKKSEDDNDDYDLSGLHCQCKIYKAKFKSFNGLKIKFSEESVYNIEESVYKIEDVLDLPKERSFSVPYIYYTSGGKNNINMDPNVVREKFLAKFRTYCEDKMNKIKLMESKGGGELNSNEHRIRDVVHGDITFSDKFWKVINTKEFQRLRRIKQLATADQVFPNAVHTRFAHSIGTYHIMKKIINHFDALFAKKDFNPIDEKEKEITLLAALLHDLGHGPYSHAFESIAKESRSHEEWTIKIINDQSTEINAVLKNEFPAGYIKGVVDRIKNEAGEFSAHKFSKFYSDLVSGTLDADRLDYLMRDAYNTLKYHDVIDLDNLILSMNITQIGSNYVVCYDEKYLSSIERFIVSRAKMYNDIYFDEYKVLTEKLLTLIFKRAYDCRESDDNNSNHKIKIANDYIRKIFENRLSIKEYLELDDNTINCFILAWKESSDMILRKLCEAFYIRGKYRSIEVEEKKGSIALDMFEKVWDVITSTSGKSNKVDSLDKVYGIFHENRKIDTYNTSNEKALWIRQSNGVIRDFSEKTWLLSKESAKKRITSDGSETNVWPINKKYYYYSSEVMCAELKSWEVPDNVIEKIADEIEVILDSYSPLNQIEIEEKYRTDLFTIEKIEELLSNEDMYISQLGNYIVKKYNNKSSSQQTDEYYDTPDCRLENSNITLRMRSKAGEEEKICTLKSKVDSKNFGGESQFARNEHEAVSVSGDIKKCNKCREMIRKHLPEKITDNFESFIEDINVKLVVVNDRKRFNVEMGENNPNFKCELSLDSVKYRDPNGTKEVEDWQVEIELKSDVSDQMEMHNFAKKLSDYITSLKGTYMQREEKSKYELGLELLRSTDGGVANE